ncbi:MAG: serine/threonine-protein kinase [Polyangiales bacterium]
MNAVSLSTRTPLVIERYVIHDEFAAGGMATVHFARVLGARGFRRTVAAKRLLPHLTRDDDFSLMLIDEARLAARVRHPNVVSTLDVVQTDSELVLVMEYVHGESLAKLARGVHERGGRIPLAIATAIVIDALHGLHAAHEAKDERGQPLALVHRDVSPQNILVGTDGISRIADFGIAKAAGRANSTPDGAVKGKLWYMSPEQLEGQSVARTTDVFAISVVLWELLTGERLFEGHSQSESICKLLVAPIPAPSARDPQLPAELDAVVARGLARDPAARYPTAREMALALERLAPPIRPSEIADWVERAAGASLARRAAMMEAIEHADDPDAEPEAEVETLLLQRVDAGARARARSDDDTPVLTPVSSASVSIERLRADATGDLPRLPTKRAPLVSIVVALMLGAGAGIWFGWRPDYAASRAAPSLAAESVDAGVAQVGIAPPTLPPSAPVEVAPAAVVAPPPARPAAPAPLPVRPLDKPRRPPRAAEKTDCDPPYSMDEKGKILFKIECM